MFRKHEWKFLYICEQKDIQGNGIYQLDSNPTTQFHKTSDICLQGTKSLPRQTNVYSKCQALKHPEKKNNREIKDQRCSFF